jgi:pyrroline-5-carboxylate reductase
MGGAMLRGWLHAGLDPRQLVVIDPFAADLPEGVTAFPAPPPDGAAPATVVLAIKPQLLDSVAPALAPVLEAETLLVSILAGVEIAYAPGSPRPAPCCG